MLRDPIPRLPDRFRSPLAGAEDFLYWSKERAGLAPFVTVTHVTIAHAASGATVITTKDVKGNPEFAVQLSKWNTQPKLADADFAFNAPAGAKPDKSVGASCGVFQ